LDPELLGVGLDLVFFFLFLFSSSLFLGSGAGFVGVGRPGASEKEKGKKKDNLIGPSIAERWWMLHMPHRSNRYKSSQRQRPDLVDLGIFTLLEGLLR
jgi:hypothetical protein